MSQKKDPKKEESSKPQNFDKQNVEKPQNTLPFVKKEKKVFFMRQKILLTFLEAAFLLFVPLAFIFNETPKPAFLNQEKTVGGPSLLSRFSSFKIKEASPIQEGNFPIVSSPAILAFILLRQDVLAGLPPKNGV